VSKLADLQILLNEQEPDLFLITESWCNQEISNSLLSIPGYSIDPNLRTDRLDTANGIGGGLLVYVKTGITVVPSVSENNFNQYCKFDIIAKNTSESINVTLVYRSPNSSNENNDKLNDLLKQTEKNSFIIGDFNYPHIDWNLHIGGDIKSRNFIDVVEDRFLHQIIDFPTHECGKILDIALVNDPSKIISAQPIGNLGNSDHSIIVIEILFDGIQGKTCEQIPDWNKADEDGFHQYLQSVDWKEKIDDRTTDEAWLSFKGILHEGICQFVPSKPRRVNNKPLWSNRYIARLSRLKQRRWNANLSNPSPENYEKYKKAEVDCKKAVRNAKCKFERNFQLQETNVHSMHM